MAVEGLSYADITIRDSKKKNIKGAEINTQL